MPQRIEAWAVDCLLEFNMETGKITLQKSDELLFHYTNIESFVSIIGHGELWASHIRYLNDTSEQRLMWDHVRARTQTKLNAPELDVYVLSFSKDGGDSLSQWRGYGGSAGVAIGFDSEELKKRCSAFTTAKSHNQRYPMGFAILTAVNYIEPYGDERANKIIDVFMKYPEVTVHESRFTKEEAFARRVSLSSSSMKHKAFCDEREWRIAIFDLPEDSVRFRTRKSMMIPYVPFDLGRGEPEWPLIKRVIVGPSSHQAETIAAIKKMLDDRVVVDGSSIPYRDW